MIVLHNTSQATLGSTPGHTPICIHICVSAEYLAEPVSVILSVSCLLQFRLKSGGPEAREE